MVNNCNFKCSIFEKVQTKSPAERAFKSSVTKARQIIAMTGF